MPRRAASADSQPAAILLDRLSAPERKRLDCRNLMVVVAHPDDETLALGGMLARMAGVRLLHVTNGAPLDMVDALACGFAEREDYADARRKELIAAMKLAGIGEENLLGLGIVDQSAAHEMAALALRLATLFSEGGVHIVITHDFEGGHPDHDATAFAVHAACHLLERERLAAPSVLEFPLYHARQGRIIVQEFAEPSPMERVSPLDAVAAHTKRQMLSEFVTQRRILGAFTLRPERIRPAHKRDFRALPNGGDIYYAQFPWGLPPSDWPGLVERASAELELPQWL